MKFSPKHLFAFVVLWSALQLCAQKPGETTFYYSPLPTTVDGDTLSIILAGSFPIDYVTIQARVRIPEFKPGAGRTGEEWTLGFKTSEGTQIGARISFEFIDYDLPAPYVNVELLSEGQVVKSVASQSFSRKPTGYNTLILNVNNLSGEMEIIGGCEDLSLIATLATDGKEMTEVFVSSPRRADVALLTARTSVEPGRFLHSGWSQEDLSQRLSGRTEGVEGWWDYLDRENMPDYARPGGKYRLAVVESQLQDGVYDIIYLGGASINPEQWHPYTLKGKLTPTPAIEGSFSLLWYDAEFNEINEECFATLSADGRILTLSFPLLQSVLRFGRKE
ncbi:MAG: hypothetical protein K2K55_00375 [Duncaniella sp.]|nr:hypothetical protein [Duncaniella sp.]